MHALRTTGRRLLGVGTVTALALAGLAVTAVFGVVSESQVRRAITASTIPAARASSPRPTCDMTS